MLIDKSEHYTRFSKSIDIIGIDTQKRRKWIL